MAHTGKMIIESLGVYLPPKVVSSKDVLQNCNRDIMFQIEELTGIKSRHVAGEGEFSIDLARKAVADCLAKSKYNPQDIDLLICCNISRYDGPNCAISFEPNTSIKLKKHFGFDRALVFDVSNACPGMFTAIYIVDAFIKAGMIQCAMVVSGEYITHLTQTAQKELEGIMDPRLACLTLGDAGVAITLEKSPNDKVGFHAIDMYTLGRYSSGCVAKATNQEHGGAIMFTDSAKLFEVTIKQTTLHSLEIFHRYRWSFDGFQHLIPHQASRRSIIDAIRSTNRLFNKKICHEGNVIDNLDKRGNTATTSHFVALIDNILNDKIKSGENVVFSIAGSGLTIGTALYTFDDFPDRLRRLVRDTETQKKIHILRGDMSAQTHHTPRVRIESVGTIPEWLRPTKDTVGLVKIAAEDCLENSSYDRSDIDLLIYAGVYRKEFILEPGIATLIAGELQINDTVEAQKKKRTLAFDIFNGALGFLNACHVAIHMIKAKKFKRVMVVASEIENNLEFPSRKLRGIKETGAAMILNEAANGRTGFGDFVFKYFTEYIESFVSYTVQEKGRTSLHFDADSKIENYYLECISETVRDLLNSEGLDISQIKIILPPQISSAFISKLSRVMNVPRDKFVDIASDGKDLFTSSFAYGLQYTSEQNLVETGDIGLIINVGTGIQVGCAIYYF